MQVVTTGTDRKITYWDAYDGQAIRVVGGSDTSEVEWGCGRVWHQPSTQYGTI